MYENISQKALIKSPFGQNIRIFVFDFVFVFSLEFSLESVHAFMVPQGLKKLQGNNGCKGQTNKSKEKHVRVKSPTTNSECCKTLTVCANLSIVPINRGINTAHFHKNEAYAPYQIYTRAEYFNLATFVHPNVFCLFVCLFVWFLFCFVLFYRYPL